MNASYSRAISRFGMAALEASGPRRGPPAPAPATPPRSRPKTVIRLWAPLTLLFWLLAPFALLLALIAAPFMVAAPARYRINPLAAAFGVGRLLLALGGTHVRVETRDALIRVR